MYRRSAAKGPEQPYVLALFIHGAKEIDEIGDRQSRRFVYCLVLPDPIDQEREARDAIEKISSRRFAFEVNANEDRLLVHVVTSWTPAPANSPLKQIPSGPAQSG